MRLRQVIETIAYDLLQIVNKVAGAGPLPVDVFGIDTTVQCATLGDAWLSSYATSAFRSGSRKSEANERIVLFSHLEFLLTESGVTGLKARACTLSCFDLDLPGILNVAQYVGSLRHFK